MLVRHRRGSDEERREKKSDRDRDFVLRLNVVQPLGKRRLTIAGAVSLRFFIFLGGEGFVLCERFVDEEFAAFGFPPCQKNIPSSPPTGS
jgi:hypothetical protein